MSDSTTKKKPIIEGAPLVKSDDPRLFNIGELAAALNVPRDFVQKMRHCGFKMPLGRATVEMAHSWLKANASLLHSHKQ